MRHATLSSLLAFVLLGCSSSDSSPAAPSDTGSAGDTAKTDTATPTDSTATDSPPSDTPTTDAPLGTCVFSGEWILEKFECGTTDITSSWKSVVGETTYVWTPGPLGCHALLRNKSTVCNEAQEFDWTIAADGMVTASTSPGITSCDPPSCKFNSTDAPCVIGDRASSDDAGTGATSRATWVKSGTKLVLTVKETKGLCGSSDQIQTYVPK